ncbi:hypothetical protein COT97_05685 [Candidatus Falkowbacteria bacterium CG10_big_fil_rev_8_21_14_0_10_39_11]|uniref:Uncharacterized protein n=1 Tax=Candidatus Falkowbacteria bacterium CG10_big_fil_rev_8_21_14_0_10_39_11 TaxID=1974565 RepID=A0A2H0V3J6_9BACT|nr:MAG: hypothetical protein COT97_05685 [Candidatus Falkowbacteria bacterium CG10_big_fil_rev_8_21_14_0_10_39_11]
MKKNTSFAIKTNIAAWIISIIFILIPGFILGETWYNLMDNKYFAGAFSLIVTFSALRLSLHNMIKNAKFEAKEKNQSLTTTWYVFILFTLLSLLLTYKNIVNRFGLSYEIIIIIAQIAVAYLAILTIKQTKNRS